ncbi:MAG: Acetylornithine deacetylase [bacterium ADurb.Bin431]|nr:MAG: Acetylornithine deacetylase [bacterium ADurb.Bin431]HNY92476.1 YgeY family selenium metabolism-linked hydrolase [bacterium]HOH06439.1 YgeY family selenium metabolism-linked hydrolase [bacterium]
MNTCYQKISSRAKELENEIVEFLLALVATPSHSGVEEKVIQVIRQEMIKAGFDEVRIDGLGSIIGRIGSGKRLIAFDAHIDTVYPGDPAQWNFDPFTPFVREGKVWGRGSVDQKGGMAAMVYAGRMIREMGLNDKFTILFTGTVMEEDCDGLCWQYLINEEKIRPELVVITEPTNMNIYRGHRGRMEMEVQVKGVSCHGSAPERGDNAIYKAARVALEIEKLNVRLRSDPFLGKGSVTVTEARSSSPSLCAVPDGAALHLDRRLTQGETRESAVAEVHDAAVRAGVPDAQVSVLTYAEPAYTGKIYPTEKYYPTWALPENSPWLQQAAAAYEGLFSRIPLIDKWTFSTNGVAIAGMNNIPCLGLGPGNEVHAHAANEACPVEHLSGAAAFYAALVAVLNEKAG